MMVPSAIRISENDAGRSGPGLRVRASVSIWPDQFELWSALKMIAMVGRTSEMSAISMRPAKKGKKRKRAITCSAVSAGAPVRLSPRTTSSNLTAPDGNSDTEVPPRRTGSSPVTARISALTASRTASAGIRNGKITRAPIPTAAKAKMMKPTRLMSTAAVTTRLSQNPRRLSPADIPRGTKGTNLQPESERLQSLCDAFVAGLAPIRPHFRARSAPFTSALQCVGRVVAGFGLVADLVERRARCKLDQGHSPAALFVDGENSEIGDHHIDHPRAGQRQRAVLEELGLVFGRMLHHHHYFFDPGDEVHGTTHAFDHLAWDHPVGEVAVLGDLHCA